MSAELLQPDVTFQVRLNAFGRLSVSFCVSVFKDGPITERMDMKHKLNI